MITVMIGGLRRPSRVRRKKVWCAMRKWVDPCWKSGMVLNPPQKAALFFESLVPSRDDNPVLKNRRKLGA